MPNSNAPATLFMFISLFNVRLYALIELQNTLPSIHLSYHRLPEYCVTFDFISHRLLSIPFSS